MGYFCKPEGHQDNGKTKGREKDSKFVAQSSMDERKLLTGKEQQHRGGERYG